MQNAVVPEIEALRQAVGREISTSDVVTPRQCDALCATLDGVALSSKLGEAAPLAIHWCLAQPAVPMREIGPDGHPVGGAFMPAVPLPRRMWAGGTLTILGPLLVGDPVTRLSRIEDVTLKAGRSGPLCFVTVTHSFSTPRGVAIEERQDIVYRGIEPQVTTTAIPRSSEAPLRAAETSRAITADPVLLFRYSALTFNSHRIHYDRDYCTKREGYPGLLVHGPLQATLLLTLAGDLRGAPKVFAFRAVSPLFDGATFHINAASTEKGLDLWIADNEGQVTMTATAVW